jgi:hypothetical protein
VRSKRKDGRSGVEGGRRETAGLTSPLNENQVFFHLSFSDLFELAHSLSIYFSISLGDDVSATYKKAQS